MSSVRRSRQADCDRPARGNVGADLRIGRTAEAIERGAGSASRDFLSPAPCVFGVVKRLPPLKPVSANPSDARPLPASRSCVGVKVRVNSRVDGKM
jgi:hypothetical protein